MDEGKDVLGKGMYGMVYKLNDKECAKVFRNCADYSREVFLYREAKWLFHDNKALEDFVRRYIVFPHRMTTFDGRLCTVMTLHQGDLFHIVKHEGAITGKKFHQLYCDVMKGSDWLHNVLGALWCDPKPDNVLLGADGGWRITDFSVWRGNTSITPRAIAFASSYRPPEILMEYPLTRMHVAEWWAIGLIFDYANVGKLAFRDDKGLSPWDLVLDQAHYVGTKDLPEETRKRLCFHGIPDDLEGVLYKTAPDAKVYAGLLHFNPEARIFEYEEGHDVPPPVHPEMTRHQVFPDNARELDGKARQRAIHGLLTSGRKNRLPCQMLVAAISIMDAVLQQRRIFTLEELTMASVSLANTLLMDDEFKRYGSRPMHFSSTMRDIYEAMMRQYPPPTFCFHLDDVIDWILSKCIYHRLPLGMASWCEYYNTQKAVEEIAHTPYEFYMRYLQFEI